MDNGDVSLSLLQLAATFVRPLVLLPSPRSSLAHATSPRRGQIPVPGIDELWSPAIHCETLYLASNIDLAALDAKPHIARRRTPKLRGWDKFGKQQAILQLTLERCILFE